MSSRQAGPWGQTAAWCRGGGPASSGAPAGSATWCRCNTRRAPRRCWSCSMRRGPGRRSTPTISGTCATSGSPCSGWTRRWGAREARPSASSFALLRPPRGTRAGAAARGRSLALAPAAGLTADADRDDRRAADCQHPRGAGADRLRRPSRRPRVRSRLGPDRQDRRRAGTAGPQGRPAGRDRIAGRRGGVRRPRQGRSRPRGRRARAEPPAGARGSAGRGAARARPGGECLWTRARRAGSGTAPRGAVPAARPGWRDAAVLAPLADRRRSGRARGESRHRRAGPALRRRCARAVHDRIARFRLGLRGRLRGRPRSGDAGRVGPGEGDRISRPQLPRAHRVDLLDARSGHPYGAPALHAGQSGSRAAARDVRDGVHRHPGAQGADRSAQRRIARRRGEGRVRPDRHHRERAPQVPASPGGARRERRRSGPSEIRTAGRRGRGHLGCAAPERDALMRWLVEKALAVPFIIVALAAGLLGVGLWCYSRMDIEAYPNPVAPMIEVITQPAGWSAEEVERYVTIPLENGLAGMIDLEHIRSQSLFGLSDVKCYFNWNPEYHTAQQRVVNRLQFIQLPPGLQPQLSPWSAIGEIFRYRVVGPGYSLAELKTAEDFILERQFRQVPGVVDVVGFGGETKEFHVDVDPYRLKGHALTLAQLTQGIANANQNVGGQRLSLGEQSFNVRGLGLIHSLDDIGQIVLAQPKAGTPVRVRDVAQVQEGAAPRLGIVGKDLEADVIQGIVLMRYGGLSLETLKGGHERGALIPQNHMVTICTEIS